MNCSHYTRDQLARFAPVPCVPCGGWVASNGTVMDRATTISRYPQMAATIHSDPRPPDARPDVNRLVGRLAWTALSLIFLALVLAAAVILLVQAL